MHWFEYSSIDALQLDYAEKIAECLSQAIASRGSACMALSGGKTPEGLYRRLAAMEIPWHQVSVTLVDDRCIEPTNPDSNEHLLRRTLLQDKAREAQWVPLYDADCETDTGLAAIEARIAALPLFDLVLLGMGEDGHTASLFPGSLGIEQALDLNSQHNVMLLHATRASYRRISMTRQRILRSRKIIVFIHGERKKEVYHQALTGSDECEMPIRAFLYQTQPEVEVVFAAD